MAKWVERRNFPFYYQDCCPFPAEAIVQVRSFYWPDVPDSIGLAWTFWWGYEEECGQIGEGVVAKARRLDKPKMQGESNNEY